MKILLILLTCLYMSLLLNNCTHTKTKQDCIEECKSRGAKYVGILPNAQRNPGYGTSYDVCQCK